MTVRWRAYAAVVTASLLWGSLYPAGKPAVEAVGPVQVAVCRCVLACVTMSAIILIRGNARGSVDRLRGRWLGIFATSLLSYSSSVVLGMVALGLLPASVNGLLNNTHPLWLALGTAIIIAPRRPGLLIGGSIVALLGMSLVFFPDLSLSSLQGDHALNPLGVALSLAGSGVIALSNVLGRYMMRRGDPIAISAAASGLAIPVLVALSLGYGGLGPILSATLSVKLLLLYLGIGCTAINFSLWLWALQHIPAAQAAAFQYMIPPIGVVISSITLGEPITAGLVVGGGLILIGLVATQAASTGRSGIRSGPATSASTVVEAR